MNIALATQETLGLMKESLAKNVTIQTGLTAYDLQAPAKISIRRSRRSEIRCLA